MTGRHVLQSYVGSLVSRTAVRRPPLYRTLYTAATSGYRRWDAKFRGFSAYTPLHGSRGDWVQKRLSSAAPDASPPPPPQQPDDPEKKEQPPPDSAGRVSRIFEERQGQLMVRALRLFAGHSSGLPFSFTRFLGRWWWGFVFNRLCPEYHHKSFYREVEQGALGALLVTFSHIAERNWGALEACVETKLLNEIQHAVFALDEHDPAINLTLLVPQVRGARLVGCRLFFGGHRDAPTDEKILLAPLTPAGFSHFLVPKGALEDLTEDGIPLTRQTVSDVSDLLRETMKRGALVRVDVLCRVQQVLALQTDSVLLTTSRNLFEPTTTFHLLRFEASLEPTADFKDDYSAPYFDWADGWKLVDMNFAVDGEFFDHFRCTRHFLCKGNYPFNPEGFQDRRSLVAIAADSNVPAAMTRSQQGAQKEDGRKEGDWGGDSPSSSLE